MYPICCDVGFVKFCNAVAALVLPVPPLVIDNAFESVNALNVGDAVVLISCGVENVNVLPEPVIVTPFALEKVTAPEVGVIDPVVPVNEFTELFALLNAPLAKEAVVFCAVYAELAKEAVIFCDAYEAEEYTLTVFAKPYAAYA